MTRVRRALGMQPIELTDAGSSASRHWPAGQRCTRSPRLPDDQREAVRAHVLDERPYEEIATQLGCSESVVRQRVSRGVRAMRARLKEWANERRSDDIERELVEAARVSRATVLGQWRELRSVMPTVRRTADGDRRRRRRAAARPTGAPDTTDSAPATTDAGPPPGPLMTRRRSRARDASPRHGAWPCGRRPVTERRRQTAQIRPLQRGRVYEQLRSRFRVVRSSRCGR